MSDNVTKLLIAARDKISAPGAWCQGSRALNIRGDLVLTCSGFAVCWCSSGACCSFDASTKEERVHALLLLDREAVDLGFPSIENFNDFPGRTQAEVTAIFNSAIQRHNQEI